MRHASFMVTTLCTVLVAACVQTPATERAGPVPADTQRAEPPVNATVLPANTHVTVTLDTVISSETARVGETFTVRVAEPIVARNSATVVPTGTVITGMVTGVTRSIGSAGTAAVRLNFLRMDLDGFNHPLSAAIVSTELFEGVVEAAVADTATTAPRGAVVRGALRDALIATAFGRGAGTVISLGTDPSEAFLPAGMRLTIRTFDELDLRR